MILEAENLSVSIGGRLVLKDLSFSLEERDFTALLGPNGAGKTTLLRTIIGYLKPGQGSLKLAGHNISSISQKRIGEILSYVPQSIQVVSDSLVDQFFASLHDTHTDRLIAELQIANFLGRRFVALSGGERQRVLLASALARAPRLLLLDELTQYADSTTTRFLGEYLSSYIAEFGLTVLAVSHDMEWVSSFTQKHLLLDNCRIGISDWKIVNLDTKRLVNNRVV